MKPLAAVSVFAAAFVALLQWWQIIYRLHLFFVQHGGRRYENHVDNFTFTPVYIVNAVVLAATIAASRVFWRAHPKWRFACLIACGLNLAAWLAFVAMHRTGVLVEYSEFIRYWKAP